MTKTVNYTPEMVAILKAEATPITYARAGELAEEFGKSLRSVVAKILSEEIEYEGKPVAPKRPKGLTKAELLAEIENALADEDGVPVLAGLEKATSQSLSALLAAL
jgi:hypothetical protein